VQEIRRIKYAIDVPGTHTAVIAQRHKRVASYRRLLANLWINKVLVTKMCGIVVAMHSHVKAIMEIRQA
jgi:hypothetical protein